jgi:type VI secretion system secreted protein VgrG
MGWNVLTMSEEGSVDLPVVVARLFDGEHPPIYPLPDAMTKVTYRTATIPADGSCNELRYEDLSGSQEMFMNASNDMQWITNDAKTETVHNDVTKSVGVNSSSDVGNSEAENVVGNQSTTVGGNDEQSTGAALMELIGADQYLSIAGLKKLYVGLTESTHVISVRQLVVGGALIDVSLGDITLTSPVTNVLVGGAMVKASVMEMNEVVNGKGAWQTIGGAKFELAGINRTGTVTGAYAETVGSTLTAKSKIYSEKADSTSDWTIGGSLIANGTTEVVVEGKSKIVLTSGGSSITITTGDVTVKAPALDQSGGNIIASGAEVKAN